MSFQRCRLWFEQHGYSPLSQRSKPTRNHNFLVFSQELIVWRTCGQSQVFSLFREELLKSQSTHWFFISPRSPAALFAEPSSVCHFFPISPPWIYLLLISGTGLNLAWTELEFTLACCVNLAIVISRPLFIISYISSTNMAYWTDCK